ncbi:MAG TPA: putative toxin-antitoxin system toxin component, PIN family [Vicinamibacteria bacterium]|nr:putative toxin-antitoxin system toxin component, PIN family [Vicinamibacteria bacterium]
MRVVLDTNMLVSGLITPYGPPSQIVRMIASGALTLCHDQRILTEYREVLLRPKFPFEPEAVGALLEQIEAVGEVVASDPLPAPLPDADDHPFLEVALSAQADALITGNLKHYPSEARRGMLVLSPADFLEHFRRSRNE